MKNILLCALILHVCLPSDYLSGFKEICFAFDTKVLSPHVAGVKVKVTRCVFKWHMLSKTILCVFNRVSIFIQFLLRYIKGLCQVRSFLWLILYLWIALMKWSGLPVRRTRQISLPKLMDATFIVSTAVSANRLLWNEPRAQSLNCISSSFIKEQRGRIPSSCAGRRVVSSALCSTGRPSVCSHPRRR